MGDFAGGIVGAVLGSFVGMPQLGWAIGSLVSGAFQKQETIRNYGPRLDDLSGPTSGIIGSQIPIVYGTDRVSLGVIWTANLKEKKRTKKSGGGGGSGGGGTVKTTTYTYSLTFAAAIAEGPILGIRKIWMNRAIVYDLDQPSIADPDLIFKVYTGSEVQLPDSIIEGYLGVGKTPAYRGLAYIRFEDLQLEKYGNRMPYTIEAEVVRDGVLSAKVERIFTSDAYYGGESKYLSNNFIVRSPNTGKMYLSARSATHISTVPVNYAFDAGGTHINSILGDQSTIPDENWDFYGQVGSTGVYFDAVGDMCFFTFQLYDGNYLNRVYLGCTIYDEDGDTIKQQYIGLIDAGSFLDIRNYETKIFVSGCQILLNTIGAPTTITLVWLDSRKSPQPDGTFKVDYAVRVDTITDSTMDEDIECNSTYVTDFYTEAIDFFRQSDTGFQGFEGDRFGSEIKSIGSLQGTGNTWWCANYRINKSPTSLTEFSAHLYVDCLELRGWPEYPSGNITCLYELILLDGNRYLFTNELFSAKYGYTTLSVYKMKPDETIINLFYYSYIGSCTESVGGVSSSMPLSATFDQNTGDVIFITLYETDRVITYNIYTGLWNASTLSGWDMIIHNSPSILLSMGGTPYYYFGVEENDRQVLCRLSLYDPAKNATTLGYICRDLAERTNIVSGDIDTDNIDSLEIKGYTIRNHSDAKANIGAVLPTYLVDPVESEWKLKFEPFKTNSIAISNSDLGCVKIGAEVEDKYSIEIGELDNIPKALALHYSGFANTYLKTQQSAIRNGFIYNHDNAETIEVPVVMEDTFSAQLVEKMLFILWISATTFRISLPRKYSYLEPTDIIHFYTNNDTESFFGKITSIEMESNNILQITGEKYIKEAITSYATGALEDSNNVQSIAVISFMYTQPLDFRPLYEIDLDINVSTSIYLVGSGYSTNWTTGQVFYSADDNNFIEVTNISNSVIFGKITTAIPEVENHHIMQHNTDIGVVVLGTETTLESITLEDLGQGMNTMIIFDASNIVVEVLQFMTAVAQSTVNTYILSDLWRRRYNTENYGTALAGYKFVIVNDQTLQQINISSDFVGKPIYVKGVSIGQYIDEVSSKEYTYNGVWAKCPSVSHLTAEETDTLVNISWKPIRRFKAELMFKDADLVQSVEKYKLEVYDFNDSLVASFADILSTSLTYTPDGVFVSIGDYMRLRIYQYSDIHFYNTDYSEITICTDPDALYATLSATPKAHLKFNDLRDSGTLLDSSATADTWTGTSLPTLLPYKGDQLINKKNGSFRQKDKGRYVRAYETIGPDDLASYSFWIKLDKKPSADHVVMGYTGGGALYGEHTIVITSSGALTFKHTSSSATWLSKTLNLGQVYHCIWVVNDHNHYLYIDNVLHSQFFYNTAIWQADGFLHIGHTTSTGIDFALDDFFVFENTVLSAADRNILYKTGYSQLEEKFK